MHDSRFLELVTKKLAGEASPEELAELSRIVTSDVGYRQQLDTYTRYWEQQDQEREGDTEMALQKVLGAINISDYTTEQSPGATVRRFSRLKKWLSAAAVLAFIAGAITVYRFNEVSDSRVAGLLQKQNAKGVKSTIELADGSKIWLNADSKVQYPTVFSGNTREIYLNGEAFFDIAKNPDRPFIIHLANGTVRVLGTSFNVKAYDNEKVVETSVATGKVAFIPKGKEKPDTIFLTPDNKMVFQLQSGEIRTNKTVSAEDKAWTEGKMVFRAMLFEDIAMELERNFGKRVVFSDSDTRAYRLTGSFQNNTLAEILFYLAKTKAFNYTISDEQIIISR